MLDSPQELLERLAFRVLYASGVTDLELFDLTYADFNPQELSLRIAPHDGKEVRFTVVDPETAALLGTYQADRPLADKIFPMGPDVLQLAIERWAAATGILDRFQGMNRRVCARMFRNAFASHCLERGMDVITLRGLLGHQFHATTFQYLKTSVERYRSVYQSCHPLTAAPS